MLSEDLGSKHGHGQVPSVTHCMLPNPLHAYPTRCLSPAVIMKPTVVEVQRSDLVSHHIDGTAWTRLGGVLLLDEAYLPAKNDFGTEATEQLTAPMLKPDALLMWLTASPRNYLL